MMDLPLGPETFSGVARSPTASYDLREARPCIAVAATLSHQNVTLRSMVICRQHQKISLFVAAWPNVLLLHMKNRCSGLAKCAMPSLSAAEVPPPRVPIDGTRY